MAAALQKKREMPDGIWMKCPGCGETVFRKRVVEELMVCPECKYHFSIPSDMRLAQLLDEDSFEEWEADLEPTDPLTFSDLRSYPERLERYQKETGLKDAVVCGRGCMGGHEVIIGVMDSRFIMASMGSVVGEKITRCLEAATELLRPLILVCASGGARMQEGLLSLMQMAKTSAAAARLKAAGGFYISVLTNPTTAGVMASFASLGDLILAEPGALIGFAGPRVIQQTIKTELPEGFQTAEFLLEHGFIDMVVPRRKLKEQIVALLNYAPEQCRLREEP